MKKTIFYGKTFYSRLKDGPLEDFIGERPIVQRMDASGNRSFTSFINWSSFLRWYLSLKEEDRTFSEVIPEGRQKFRLDIDAICERTPLIRDSELIKSNFHSLECPYKKSFCEAKCLLYGEKTLVYESIDPLEKKLSYHIVFPDLILESSYECRLMLEEIKERLDAEDLSPFFDDSVYKSLQCFRIEGSRKSDDTRYKYLMGRTTVSEFFFDGLITEQE